MFAVQHRQISNVSSGIVMSSLFNCRAFLNSSRLIRSIKMLVLQPEKALLFLFTNISNTIIQCNTRMKRVPKCNVLHPAPSCRALSALNSRPILWLVTHKPRRSSVRLIPLVDACTLGLNSPTTVSLKHTPTTSTDYMSMSSELMQNVTQSANNYVH